MSISVERITNGNWSENCFLVSLGDGKVIIIDPGSDAHVIEAALAVRNWQPLAIVNTHGHYDHIGAVADLQDRFGIPFYLHSADLHLLQRANLYKMIWDSFSPVRVPSEPRCINELAELGRPEVSFEHLPGHTQGSCAILVGGHIFTGDLLINGAPGRTDLPGGDRDRIKESLRHLIRLPGSLELHPGHGNSSRLATAIEGLDIF